MIEEFESLGSILKQRAIRQANQLAYCYLHYRRNEEPGEITYEALYQKALQVSDSFRNTISAGDRVILLLPTGLEFVVSFFACMILGAIPSCVPPPRNSQAEQRLRDIVTYSGAKLVLSDRDFFENREQLNAQLTSDCAVSAFELNQIAGTPPRSGVYEANQNEPAFLQFTSGSTGTPKGVIVSHGSLHATLSDLHQGFHHNEQSRIVTWLPFNHDMGLIYGLLQPLFCGFPCYFMSPMAFVQKPYRWLEAISKFKGTHTAAPNFAYELCVNAIKPEKANSLDLSHWRVALNGAEPVRAEILQRFEQYYSVAGFKDTTFSPGYGMAEASLKIAALESHKRYTTIYVDSECLSLGQIELVDPVKHANSKCLVGNGRSHIDSRIIIVDPQTRTPQAQNAVGEIWVQSKSVAQGYWADESTSRDVFQGYLSNGTGPFLRTGDLGFVLDEELFITGRLKDVLIIQGRNHHAEDIEFLVQQSHDDLKPAYGAAFPLDVDGEEKVVIVQEVKRTSLRSLQSDNVFTEIRKHIALHLDLSVYVILLVGPGSVLRTTSGKIQRGMCKQRYLQNEFDVIAASGPYKHPLQKTL